MSERRRRRGTGTIRQEGRGWSLRICRGNTGTYISGFETREAAEDAARAIAGQRMAARMMSAVTRAAMPSASDDPFAWAEARWSEMNPRERQAVTFARFRGCCVYCARPVALPTRREVGRADRAVMDHRIPVTSGGADSFGNVVLSCHGCNAKKLDEHPPV